MNTFQILLLIVMIILAFPLGYLLARATKEELRDGRKAFVAIIIGCVIIILSSLFSGFSREENLFIAAAMIFISIVSYISFKKSYQYEKEKKTRRKKIRRKK